MEVELESNNTSLVHVLMVSCPSQSHINPFLRLTKFIASNGPLVAFSTNAATGHQMATATGNVNGTVLPVGQGHLQFEYFDDGCDLIADSVDTQMTKLETAGFAALEALIRRQADAGQPVTQIVNNPFLPWVVDVAARTGIEWSLLWVQSCAILSLYLHRARFLGAFPECAAEWGSFELALSGLSTLTAKDLPTFLTPTPRGAN